MVRPIAAGAVRPSAPRPREAAGTAGMIAPDGSGAASEETGDDALPTRDDARRDAASDATAGADDLGPQTPDPTDAPRADSGPPGAGGPPPPVRAVGERQAAWIYVFSGWCPPCREFARRHMQQVYERYRS